MASGVERKRAGTNSGVGYAKNGTLLKRRLMLSQNHLKVTVYNLRTHRVKPEDDHARQVVPACGEEIGEVEVMRQEHGAFPTRFAEDVRICQSFKTFADEVAGLMA